jgi:hypothetical protein
MRRLSFPSKFISFRFSVVSHLINGNKQQQQNFSIALFTHQQKRFNSSTTTTQEEDFDFDASAAITKDAEQVSQQERTEKLVRSLLAPYGNPPNEEAVAKLRDHFTKEPINDCITAERVVITHVANEAGEDTKLKLPEMSFEEALEQAKNNNRDLQQVALNRGVAYCRLRDAKKKAIESVADILGLAKETPAAATDDGPNADILNTPAGQAAAKIFKKRELNLHTFRDAVDSHFCDWRGAKIASELARGHPIKLQILQFLSPQSANHKMQEMMKSIKHYSEVDKDFESGLKKEPRPIVGHQSTGIHVSDKELAVTLQPTGPGQSIKHPSDGDWKAALRRHEQLCNKSDRKTAGTYQEMKGKTKRSSGVRMVRMDRFGNKIEE